MRPSARVIIASLSLAGGVAPFTVADATEGGASLYVPGVSVPEAGILPPEGIYFDSTAYFYSGKLTGNRQTVIGGNVVASVKVDLWATSSPVSGSPRSRSSAATWRSVSPCRSENPTCGPA